MQGAGAHRATESRGCVFDGNGTVGKHEEGLKVGTQLLSAQLLGTRLLPPSEGPIPLAEIDPSMACLLWKETCIFGDPQKQLLEGQRLGSSDTSQLIIPTMC